MKKGNYIWLLIISAILTSTIFIKLCDGIMSNVSIICDFLAMIGAGIFCSTIVSWIVDIQNKNKDKHIKIEQRNFIFATVKGSFVHLYRRELSNMSVYYSQHLAKHETEWINEELSLTQVSEKILWLIEQFEADSLEEEKGNCIVVTPQTIRKEEQKSSYLINNSMRYYKSLHRALTELSSSYDIYFMGDLINKEDVETLKELTWEIDDILLYDSNDNIDDGMVLELKKILFEKTTQYISIFDNLEYIKPQMHYKNVFDD